MEQLTTRIGIEPGPGLVGRFGETVIVIPRGQAAGSAPAGAVEELLGLAAEVESDRQAPANAIASRLAAWVIGHMSGDAPAFGIVSPDARWHGHVPPWCGVVHDHRGRIDPRGIRRAGPYLGRPDRARHVRSAGDRRRSWPAGTGGAVVRPLGRGSAWAGLRAEPDRGYPRAPRALRGGTGRVRRCPGRCRHCVRGGTGRGRFGRLRVAIVRGDAGTAGADQRPMDQPAADRPQEAWALRAEPRGLPARTRRPPARTRGLPARPADRQPEPADRQPEPADRQPEPADRQPEPADYQPEPPRHQPTMVVWQTDEQDVPPGRAEPPPAPAVQPTTVSPLPPRPTATPVPVGVLTSPDAPPIVLDGVLSSAGNPGKIPRWRAGRLRRFSFRIRTT